MKKILKIVFLALFIGILIAIVFQFKIVSHENGEKVFVYTLPFGNSGLYGSAGSDLRDQLIPLYGKDDIEVEQYRGQWKGKNIIVYDKSKYDFKYLGQSVGGDNFISCEVFTIRSVKFDDEEKVIETKRTSTYIGYDDNDLNSVIRAKILWGTLKEEYSDSEGYFNDFIIE